MTQSLAPTDPYTTRFEAAVTAVDGRDVTLSETYFYPVGGGQPADRGRLAGVPVEHVAEADDAVVHTLVEEPDVQVGEVVAGEIDEEFRTYCMRAHTASHVLYGAGRRLLSDLGYGGFDIGETKVRVDFETTTDVDDDVLVELERLANRAVWDSRAVSWEEVPQADAVARDDIAFNVATEEGVMADSDTVRVVDVDGWDVSACGGTHVENTREIGLVAVRDRSNPGEGLTRVEFSVGEAAVDSRAEERRAAFAAARDLGVPREELDAGVDSLHANVEELEGERERLRDALLEARLDGFSSFERDGARWLVGTVDALDANAVADRLREAAAGRADVVAVAGGGERAFLVVASTGDVDAGGVVDEVTAEFGGGGGGGGALAQGGGLDASATDVVDSLGG
ncbi:alanyl-tRNA editing protein [Halocalculus aciditolerans]|uniref:Alanyl-transfer RNA synthetases family profile domain-containing protein n=1 Tax=Halocalculus aciditolerans TaxID=1383812 RepID=A0A830F1I5_9EURY|nr:alanyl-tRNA editing protein [Halocalculus aciditolerans]GGL53404.1 hypothetical protein GCM10009039_09490 [Halocalculus aciditolerans]